MRLSWSDGFADYVGHNVLATQRLLEAVQSRRVRRRASCTRRRRRCTATSRATRRSRPICPSRSARTASPSSRPSTSAVCTPRTGACTRCRCGTSPCSVRGNGPTCRSTACARPRSTASTFPRYGDGTQIREFTYVDDIVAGNLAAADARRRARHVREPRGRRRDHAQRADRARRRARGRAGRRSSREPKKAGDSFRNGGAIDRARELLGWEPQVSLRDGVAAQIAWHRSRRSSARASSPRSTVIARPMSSVRSPRARTCTVAAARRRLVRVQLGRAEALAPVRRRARSASNR